MKQEADGRIVLGWDWRFEESRTVSVNVIRMSAMRDAQSLTEIRVSIFGKLKLDGFVPFSPYFPTV